jgi:hypothetical protein
VDVLRESGVQKGYWILSGAGGAAPATGEDKFTG